MNSCFWSLNSSDCKADILAYELPYYFHHCQSLHWLHLWKCFSVRFHVSLPEAEKLFGRPSAVETSPQSRMRSASSSEKKSEVRFLALFTSLPDGLMADGGRKKMIQNIQFGQLCLFQDFKTSCSLVLLLHLNTYLWTTVIFGTYCLLDNNWKKMQLTSSYMIDRQSLQSRA